MDGVSRILLAGLGGGLGALVGLALAKLAPRSWATLLCIATGVMGAQLLPAVAQPWIQAREVDAFLASDPLFSVIVADYPALKPSLRESLIRGEDAEAIRRDLLGSVAKKYLAKAPDDAVVELAQATLSALRSLQSNPEACHQFLFPGNGPSVRLPDGPRDRTYAALVKVVESGHRVHTSPPLTDETESIRRALATLTEKYGDDVEVLQRATAAGVDRDLVCRMTIAFYDEVMKLPDDDVSRALRWIFTDRDASRAQSP